MTTDAEVSPVHAIIIAQGKVLDFIDGRTQRPDTPEEYVRQEIAKSLVREYKYAKADIEVEFVVRVGTRKPRADLRLSSRAPCPSIPHIDTTDFSELEIVRLKNTDENAIADLAEASAKARAEADVIERSIAHQASAIIERFMSVQIT